MPPKTAGKTPVIVYLDDDVWELLKLLAEEEDRPLSAAARRILTQHLRDPETGRISSRT
jgi:plasmid stability protein